MSFVIYYNTVSKTRYPNPHFMQTQGFNIGDPEIVELDYTRPEHDSRVEIVTDTRTESEVDGVWKINYEVTPLADEVIYDNLHDGYVKAIEAKALLPFATGVNGLVLKTDDKSLYLLDSLIKTKQANIELTLAYPICVEGELPDDLSQLLQIQSDLVAHVDQYKAMKGQLKGYLVGSNVEAIKSTTAEQWVLNNLNQGI